VNGWPPLPTFDIAAVAAYAGASTAVAAVIAGAGLLADAVSGLPQSIQNREAGSLAAPQKLHGVTLGPPARNMAWAANIRRGDRQAQRQICGQRSQIRHVPVLTSFS
jgi:hypothetical protein